MSYRITKILNHNSFMGIESKNDQECLIMGKGVAFGKKVGQTVSVTGDARVYSLKELTDRGEAKEIIKSVSPLCLELANEVLDQAEEEAKATIAEHERIRQKRNLERLTVPFFLPWQTILISLSAVYRTVNRSVIH